VKEFLEHNKELGVQFLKEGFFLANSIPYMSMDIRWHNFSAYITSLRHSYRRHILRSLHKVKCEEPVIIHSDEYDGNSPRITWVLSEPGWMSPQQYHHLYMKVMERTKTKLETLNEDFFTELFKDASHYQLLSLVERGNILSSALLVPHGDTLTFMLSGRENDKDEYDSYFNLVYGIVALAIQCGCKKLKLGQTAYWVKQCVGGLPEQELIYFASRRPVIHRILKSLRNVIFPELTVKTVEIFHKTDIKKLSVGYER
jgi:predicted N-acyltransferase